MSDLDAMRSLAEVVRCGSVTEAARRLGLSQPAVSGHLKALEEKLGRALTRRKGRGVEPTAVARELAARTGPALDVLADAFEDAGEVASRPVRLGGPRAYLLARGVPALATHLDAPVRITIEARTDRLIELMEDGELDLGVFSGRPDPARIEVRDLELDRTALVAHPKWVELAGRPLLDILKSAPALTVDPRLSDLARHLHDSVDEPRLAWKVAAPRLIAPDPALLRAAALAGGGVAAIALHLVETDLDTGALVRLDDMQAPAPIFRLGWLRAARLTASARQARDVLANAARAYEDARSR